MDKQGILDILAALGLDTRKSKLSREHLQMLCPLHDDSDPSFSVLLAAGGPWMCFGCGSSGKHMGELIREIEQLRGSQTKAWDLWRKDVDAWVQAKGGRGSIPEEPEPMTPEQELAALESKLTAMEWEGAKARDDRLRFEYDTMPEGQYRPYSFCAAKYFQTRGLNDLTCEYWDLGDDETMQRALLPIRDFQGYLVGVQGRTYAINCKCGLPLAEFVKHPNAVKSETGKVHRCPVCGEPRPIKYLTTAGFEKSLFLFGEHMLDRDRKEAIVVESPMSVLWLWQHGYQNVLATMGSIPSEFQVRKLTTWFHSIFLFADGDPRTHPKILPAGERWMWYLRTAMEKYVIMRHWTYPVGQDPADIPKDGLLGILGTPTGIRKDIRTRAKDDPGRQAVLMYV